jgi:hypothetical protein
MAAILWCEELDESDNTFYEGPSPYHNKTTPILWRLRKRLWANKIEWYADHDGELGGRTGEWDSLNDAQVATQDDHNTVLKCLCDPFLQEVSRIANNNP